MTTCWLARWPLKVFRLIILRMCSQQARRRSNTNSNRSRELEEAAIDAREGEREEICSERASPL